MLPTSDPTDVAVHTRDASSVFGSLPFFKEQRGLLEGA